MKLGILADIHEDAEALREAIGRLRSAGAERLVVLGDVFYDGGHADETAELLRTSGAVGVWGNHDLGLCHQPDPLLLARYSEGVFGFARTLEAQLAIEDCLFTHGLPCQDPFDPVGYYLGERPESDAGHAASFAATGERVLFLGHFHRWVAATPEGLLPWRGDAPITLEQARRYFVVIAAVCDGWCAAYDTASGLLTPHRLRAST